MTKEELNQLSQYMSQVKSLYENDVKYITNELRDEIFNYIEKLMGKYNWSITADDTHRWVESDGWYEVEFMMTTENGEVYINTVSGDMELQEEWSKNNPQSASLCDCGLWCHCWDWYYFINCLIEKYKDGSNSDI